MFGNHAAHSRLSSWLRTTRGAHVDRRTGRAVMVRVTPRRAERRTPGTEQVEDISEGKLWLRERKGTAQFRVTGLLPVSKLRFPTERLEKALMLFSLQWHLI